jgi:hypothetical protein
MFSIANVFIYFQCNADAKCWKGGCVSKIELVVDGKKVRTNPYVTSVFTGVIEALISTLKDINKNWSKAEIRLER